MRQILLIFIITLTSCSNPTYKVDDFKTDELVWYIPFTKADSIIFISEKGERDTIIFGTSLL